MAGKDKKKKQSKVVRVILTIIEIACLCVALFAGYKLYDSWHTNKQSEETYADLSDEIVSTATPDPSASASSENEKVIDWDALLSINSDAAAWIYQEGTPIDYPVVYATDNEHYLYYDIYNNSSPWGVPFVDCNNNRGFVDKNTVIYGHSGNHYDLVFSTLDNYREQSYYDAHKEFDLYTQDAHYKLYPIAGYETVGSDPYVITSFASDDEFLDYVNGFIEKSLFVSDETITKDDKTVLLSTCQFHMEDGRFALLCKMVQVS
jgi:sortase B